MNKNKIIVDNNRKPTTNLVGFFISADYADLNEGTERNSRMKEMKNEYIVKGELITSNEIGRQSTTNN